MARLTAKRLLALTTAGLAGRVLAAAKRAVSPGWPEAGRREYARRRSSGEAA